MIVLLGGPSATGKSTLAESLSRRFGLQHIDLDLFYLAFREIVPPESAPVLLHPQEGAFWTAPVDDLLRCYLELQEFLAPALESVVASLLARQRRALLEGTWLLPALAARRTFKDVDSGDVRALFLFEPDADEMDRRRRNRQDPWSRVFAEPVMQNIAAMRHAHGLELKGQAEALGLPVLECRPFETLETRALAALGLDDARSVRTSTTERNQANPQA
jgi:2-phosphoglycerate kinase